MKKPLLIILIILVLLAGVVLAAWKYLPQIGIYALGKAIGGTVEVGRYQFSFEKGLLGIELNEVRAKGAVTGTIKKCLIRLKIGRSVYVKYFNMADFDIAVGQGKQGPSIYPVPVESAQIERGTVLYGGRKFVIRELTVKHFNTGGPFEFSFDGGSEGLGNLKTKGGGLFQDERSDLKGQYAIAGLEMGTILKGYRATLRSEGTFTYKNETLTVEGKVEGSPFWMFETFLKKPLAFDHKSAGIKVIWKGPAIEIFLDNIEVRGATLALDIREDMMIVNRIEVVCGFVDVPFFKEYINTEMLGDRIPQVIQRVTDGEARIKGLVWDRQKPFSAEINVKDLKADYENFKFTQIEGTLLFSGETLTLSDLRGRYQESTFFNVNGTVPFSAGKEVRVKGNYSVDMKDVVPFLKAEGLVIESGRTEGLLDVRGREDAPLIVGGTGSLGETQFVWKKARLKAQGEYVIRDREISFDPLSVMDGVTDLVLKGRASEEGIEAKATGFIGAGLIKDLTRFAYSLEGIVSLDGQFEKKRGGEVFAHCNASMKEVSFEIPGFIRKSKGIESRLDFGVRLAPESVNIERLSYNLGDLFLEGRGHIGPGGGTDFQVAMAVQGLEKVEQFFFFENGKAGGDVSLDLSVSDMSLPLKKLPLIDGTVRIKNGSFALPSMKKPLEKVDVNCAFKGTLFDMDIEGLQVGTSQVKQGKLLVRGGPPLSFSLSLDMDNFNPADFAARRKKTFRIPTMPADGLLSTAAGDINVNIRRVKINQAEAGDLMVKGRLRERRLEVGEVRANAFDGAVHLQGLADLSTDPPLVELSGQADGLDGDEFSKLFGPTTRIFSGKGAIFGYLSGSGRDGDELLRGLEGNVTIYSRNGIIRRWNLLSKIFGLLNLYDLFRGKVDLVHTGLPYSRVGAVFEGHKGVFSTDDFLIDSPSMLITGRGDVWPAEGVMKGALTVSPLVTLDKAINAVPLLRSLIKEKKKGFLYAIYNVKGPVGDPQVSSAYVASIGARTLDILKNIFNLPTEVFEQ